MSELEFWYHHVGVSVPNMDEAIEWARRCPNPHPSDCEIELRPVFEAEDFGAALTPEIQARNAGLRA